ncbi:transmembrane ascorbate-dependent reductase CYB561 [Diorhabda carinulata]|uniref:transmembrane ascorbate-dependent reductase CYB561-like n=1 Tax=Diorhabda sublineata TaxID=1163346 RepID=UPI0024E07B14|nr:transmembrane ascorbate-dependent reductase CYB561-like [Diorhabda sublineata]XP_057659002.1 transmembrane ascorbate-dependent reductase CYB561 [Diorhabda carinulata]
MIQRYRRAAELEEQSVSLLGTPNMEARTEHQKVKHYQLLYTLTTSIGIGTIILVLFWILYYQNGFAWQSLPRVQFNWHPLLMIIGMVFFYSQAMLIYRTGRNYQKNTLKLVHMSLNLLAFILAVIALKAVFDSHNLTGTANMYTLHSWIGLTTVIVFALQFLAGFVTFLYPGLSPSIRKALLPTHVAFGSGCFAGAIIASASGFLEKAIFQKIYDQNVTEGIVVNILGLSIAFFGVLVLHLVHNVDYKRVPLADDQIVLERSDN